MAAEEAEKDILPGGILLPSNLSIVKFVACRSQEIQLMKKSLIVQSGTKLAFQTIPKHMRRRAMSHNVKRLPRRLRQIHLNQMKKSGMPTKQKRPSRKYRRRPRNMIQEYTKRGSKRYKWLQTHIWHAKRFRMIEKWGYKLPYRPCDKAFRACYRAMSQHCLLQDISYLNCVEISGDKNLIIVNLKKLWKPDGGLSIGAKAFTQGNREGELTLYEFQEPQRPIGKINFQWQPDGTDKFSKLWLWVHSAYYENALESLRMCLENVKIEELGNKLCRFRLSGPLSNSLLHDAVVPINGDSSNLVEYTEIIKNQYDYWNNMDHTTSNISPHSVFALIVEDPRFNLPRKQTKSVQILNSNIYHEMSPNCATSPLWNENIRAQVASKRVSDAEVAAMRAKLLVPGSTLDQTKAQIPIILIQRPGSKSGLIGLGGGWDIILPSVWAKTFWIAMIMRGARAGGLRETNSILFEMGRPQFLQPDTKAGMDEDLEISKECREKFFRKPPNKRINYNKFKIVSPFACNWELLTKEWNDNSIPSSFYVLRNKRILQLIEAFITKTNSIPEYPRNCLIPVKLDCVKGGAPAQFSVICLPKSESDFKSPLNEPICEDKFQAERKELRSAHHRLLKKLRKQRKIKEQIKSEEYKEILANYTQQMRALWLPQPTAIRNSCSREVIGFVTNGGFSFTHAMGTATGYITSDCLPALKKFGDKILFRNVNSRLYRVANLSVILE